MTAIAILSPDIGRKRGRTGQIPVTLVIASVLMIIVVLLAILDTAIVPFDPTAQDLSIGLSTPNGAHLLGTDQLGRDVFSRVIAGARAALIGPIIITLISMLAGNILGLLAGYHGGWIDSVIMRWVDIMWSIPSILVVIVAASALGGGYWLTVGLLTLLSIPFDTRVVRGAVLEQMPLPYVEAARVLGLSNFRIATIHVWPNILPTVVANTFLVFSSSLVAIASVSFLGLGIDPSTPDWGVMISQNQALLFANPLAVLAPALMIVITAASMNAIGDTTFTLLSQRGTRR